MVCDCHLISDPLYQHTWSCLQHYNYKEAIFTAERIFAENPNDESIYLLATCFYRSNGPKQARNFILRQDTKSSKCRYLLAKCYMDIGNNAAAENTLLGVNQELENPTAVVAFYKDIASFVLRMLADIFRQSERRKLAISYLRKCLDLDPLCWSAYTDLVDLLDNVEPTEVFSLPKGVVLNNQSCLRALNNKINTGEIEHPVCPSKKRTDLHDSQEYLSVSRENVNPKNNEKFNDSENSTDLIHLTEEQLSYSFNDSVPRVHTDSVSDLLLPDFNSIQAKIQTRQKIFVPKQSRRETEEMEVECPKPLFGNLCVGSSATMFGSMPVFNIRPPELTEPVHSHNSSYHTPIAKQNMGFKKIHNNTKRVSFGPINLTSPIGEARPQIVSTRMDSKYTTSTPNHKHDSLNYNLSSSIQMLPSQNEQSRMISGDMIVCESDFQLPSSAMKTRLQASKEAAAAQKCASKKEDEHGFEECGNEGKMTTESDITLQSALYYLQLLVSMGRVYKSIKYYKLTDAIAQFRQIPKKHAKTALVSSWMAAAYLEMNQKEKACTILSLSYQNEPWQLHGLTLFSSALWTLNKEKELISLANDMLDMDRDCPEVWCVFGNLMSLNKETETSIRFFQRVIQVCPSYAYGYMLLGHEYFAQDELDKALIAYRRALELDSNCYHPSYCIAGIYQRQDNYIEAEKTLKEALKMFPDSHVLLTNLAVVRSKLKQHFSLESVLELLERACRLYPEEPKSRYQRATILFQNGRCKEALSDLKAISDDVKEARIYLLMSVIYKQMGELTNAMLYNKRATDIDPKCTNDCFMLDRNFSGTSIGHGSDLNTSMSSVSNSSSFMVSGRRNSESTMPDEAGNGTTTATSATGSANINNSHITYEMLDAD